MKDEKQSADRSRMGQNRFLILLPSAFCLFLSGCAAFGVAAKAIPQTRPPAYQGLAGQSVGVMVWADRSVRIDWPSVQIELAMLVQDKLQKSRAPELKNATWPVQPASIVRYQRDHPGIEAMPITDVAPKLGVSRLIYIEIENLRTRSDVSMQMYRGQVSASLKVIEVDGQRAAVAYEESEIRAVFPPKSPPEGVLNSTDAVMYRGVLAALSDQIVNRFITHEISH